MTDPIADLLTRIRNAQLARKRELTVPHSKLKFAIAKILAREGYLSEVAEERSGRPQLLITLKYADGISAIQHLKRVSTPGHRRYLKHAAIKPVLQGLGIAILSTPAGVLTDREAKAAGVGGELLCEIY